MSKYIVEVVVIERRRYALEAETPEQAGDRAYSLYLQRRVPSAHLVEVRRCWSRYDWGEEETFDDD